MREQIFIHSEQVSDREIMNDSPIEKALENLSLDEINEIPEEDLEENPAYDPDDDAWDAVTPPERLTDLAGSRLAYIREGVASNRSTPSGVLHTLAQDSSPAVRQAVANNTSAAPETISLLVRDPDPSVRARAASSASLAPGEVGVLSADMSGDVLSLDPPISFVSRVSEA